MPLDISTQGSTFIIRKEAFERAGLTRGSLDELLNLTADEFRVERDVIAVGPLPAGQSSVELIDQLERAGLVYHDDFFELPGGWPEWLRILAIGSGRDR